MKRRVVIEQRRRVEAGAGRQLETDASPSVLDAAGAAAVHEAQRVAGGRERLHGAWRRALISRAERRFR